jgi:multiubiquitin
MAAPVPEPAPDAARPKPVTIIISGRAFEVEEKDISYEEVVDLRYAGNPPTGENVRITVTYSKGHNGKEGTLRPGHSVKVKAGMVFNVVDSSQS